MLRAHLGGKPDDARQYKRVCGRRAEGVVKGEVGSAMANVAVPKGGTHALSRHQYTREVERQRQMDLTVRGARHAVCTQQDGCHYCQRVLAGVLQAAGQAVAVPQHSPSTMAATSSSVFS